ncbi:MAG: hypothetical protein JSS82_04310 [Bacteroidetes bacterium]|nr:hypothetical protein [Bacteroidota bacterium]
MQQRTALLLRALDSVPAKMKGAVEAEIHIADSVHFRFLRRYINETGWPDLAHGSLYAAYIAARDVEHVADYVPKAYLAFQNGQLGMAAVNRLYQNRYFLSNVLTVMPLLQGHGLKFDVSSFLEGDVPSNLQQVLSAVHQHCPIKDIVCVLECNWSQSARQAYGLMYEFKNGADNWLRFVSGVGDACPSWNNRSLVHAIMTYRMPYDRKASRLIAYVLFD